MLKAFMFQEMMMFQDNNKMMIEAINTIEKIVEKALKEAVFEDDILENYFDNHHVA